MLNHSFRTNPVVTLMGSLPYGTRIAILRDQIFILYVKVSHPYHTEEFEGGPLSGQSFITM